MDWPCFDWLLDRITGDDSRLYIYTHPHTHTHTHTSWWRGYFRSCFLYDDVSPTLPIKYYNVMWTAEFPKAWWAVEPAVKTLLVTTKGCCKTPKSHNPQQEYHTISEEALCSQIRHTLTITGCYMSACPLTEFWVKPYTFFTVLQGEIT